VVQKALQVEEDFFSFAARFQRAAPYSLVKGEA
jgi:hypothetical protein